MAKGVSTIYTFLMYNSAEAGATGNWEKVVDITDFPDLIPAPETIEVTTLSDTVRQYILGLKDSSDRAFTANYTKANYQAVKALEGAVQHLAVWIGGTPDGNGGATPTGSEGKVAFDGTLAVSLNGAGVGDAHTMTITVATQSDDTFSAA